MPFLLNFVFFFFYVNFLPDGEDSKYSSQPIANILGFSLFGSFDLGALDLNGADGVKSINAALLLDPRRQLYQYTATYNGHSFEAGYWMTLTGSPTSKCMMF